MTQPARVAFTLAILAIITLACPQRASAANVANYGADGMDYFQFTTPSMAFDKASGFTTLITFAMHVNADGTLLIGGVACSNGVYVGPANWGSLVATLKTSPTTVTRYEVCIGGWGDTSYDNIKSLVASQGTGTGSTLYKNFQALKNAVPGIDAINDDDEQTYDLNSTTSFASMLGTLGYKFTMAPYMNQSYWVSLKNNINNCDYIYVQCYEGGAGNDPSQWQSAMGSGVTVIGGQESNTATPAIFRNWYLEGNQGGGFYYPDIVFNSTYWSAAVIEANGAVPAAPVAAAVIQGSTQVGLSWNTVPGAISYNVKRSTSSGGETTIANVSTVNNNWPASNQYTDTGLSTGTTYYYKVSAVNTNGEGLNSAEVSATPQVPSVWSGLGSDNNWGTSGNWNVALTSSGGLDFAGSTRLANNNNLASFAAYSITFDAAAGAFVLSGNGIILNGNIGFSGNPAAPITQTINFNMAWNASALDVDTPVNGNLVLGGAITSSADYSLNKTSAGTLTLGGINTIAGMGVNGGTNVITGNTTINGNGDGGDRLYLGDGDFLNGCNGTLVIQPGAVLGVTGSFGDNFVIGRDSGSGRVIQYGGTFTFNPANNMSMVLAATGDPRTRAEYDMNGGLLDMKGNTLTVGWGATLVTGVVNQVGGVITNLGSLVIPVTSGANGLGIYTLNGGSVYIGASGITTAGGSSRYAINLGGGTVGAYQSWASSLNMSLTGTNGSVTFDTGPNTITLSGALSGSGGLTKVGSGTLILSGANTIASMSVNGGTNIITGNTTINGNGGHIYVGDGDALNGCNGTLVIQPGAVLGVTGSFGDNFVIGRDSGSGRVIQYGGTFTFNPANNITMLLSATGDTRTRAEYDMNGGLLDMKGNTLTVGWGATLVTGVVNQVGGVITNLGSLVIPVTSGANGLGIYTLNGGSVYIGASGITTAGGSSRYAINLGGGTVGAYQSWASSLNMSLTGTNGSVTFDTGPNTITLSGALSGSGGLTKAGAGTLILSGVNTYTGNTTVNAGVLQLNRAGSSPGGLYLVNGGWLNLNYSGADVLAAFYTNGVALPNGTYTSSNLPGFITGAGSLQVLGLVTVLNSGFETPVISNYQYNPSGSSWTFSGVSPSGSGLVANGSGFNNPNAPEGSQAAFVQEYGAMSQTISGFVPGITYTITFSAAERPGIYQHGGESWNVTIDGTVIGSYNPGSNATTYVDYTATFTATAATHTLAFVGTDLITGDNTVFIDNVRITDPSSSLPSPWQTQNIGVTGAAGSASYNGGTFTLIGAGTNVAGTADSFRFLYQSSSADCTNTVRVATLQNTAVNTNAKAGVMIRESLNANAREAGVWVTPSNGISFTCRTNTGVTTITTTSAGKTAPYWVRIARTGNAFRGYYSTNGTAWTQLGSTTTNAMSTSAYIGMGVDSGVSNILNTATMDNTTTIP